uniref:Reverse transcriptase RNase H-like domain-containing protein n=1 Tax=Lactuca sativa TaxID=4236 RepID=A0A9R1XDB8_LACSA|nr:hypothetical protein LSAT_V11C500253120 [Lactuca sativa]
MLGSLVPGEMMQVYLSVSNKGELLQGLETNYRILEKLLVTLIYAARSFRRYFQAHYIQVLLKFPIKQILLKPKTSRRLAKWAIKLGEHDISYRPRTNIKGKAFTYFLLEIPNEVNPEIHKKESSDTGRIRGLTRQPIISKANGCKNDNSSHGFKFSN